MNKTKLFIIFAISISSFLASTAHASDACESVLCLFGKMTGNGGGDDCKSAEKNFFNILRKKKSSIKWNETFDARKDFLNQCKEADPAYISKIMSSFGKVKG